MQYSISLDLRRINEWGISLQAGVLFAYLHSEIGWAQVEVLSHEGEREAFRWVSRQKLIDELPSLGETKRNVSRLLSRLRDVGLIVTVQHDGKLWVRITDKGARWHKCDPEPAAKKQMDFERDPMTEPSPPLDTSVTPPLTLLSPPPLTELSPNQINQLSINQDQTLVPSDDGTRSEPSKSDVGDLQKTSSGRIDYPEWFEQLWDRYPKRSGGNSKKAAFKAVRARLRQGAKLDDVAAGLNRYARYVQSKQMAGTRYVLQAATFFGPDEHWLEDWGVEARGQRRRLDSLHTSIDEMATRDYSQYRTGMSIEEAFSIKPGGSK